MLLTERKYQPVFILGPTGVGKTTLALAIARQLPCEIISVDSAMVYRGMKIGTALPTPEQCGNIPYHLTGFIDPSNSYSVGNFCADAIHYIRQIQQKAKIPLLVGGSMFYFHALEHGLDKMPEIDSQVRKKIQLLENQIGTNALHQILSRQDPLIASRLHPNDRQRIKRALEVNVQCGAPMSSFQEGKKEGYEKVSPAVKIALEFSNTTLQRTTLSTRFDQMLENGFIEEVCRLLLRGDLSHETPAIRAVGYRQIWKFLCGKYNRTTMRKQTITATMQLVKRQMLWMKKMPGLLRFADESVHLTDMIDLISSAQPSDAA